MSTFAAWIERSFVEVSGLDAVTFLQGQLSQDVAGLAPGSTTWSFLLQPQGKVDAFLRVTRTGDDAVLLDTDGGFGGAVVERLERFKLRVKADVRELAWRCLAVRGTSTVDAGTALALPVAWPGFGGVDLVGEAVEVPAGVEVVDTSVYEQARVAAGVPAMGRELTERTIPGESLLVPLSVSFTKGCYTGQELVARIDSRGNNVPRLLRRVVVEGHEVPAGASLEVEGRGVGEVTSAAAQGAGTVALAYVRREVEPPAAASVRWEGGTAVARIEALPPVS